MVNLTRSRLVSSDALAASAFIELDAVCLDYGRGPFGAALSDVTLRVDKGQFAAVVGPSGCGKSSLLKLVSGLIPASSGEVRVGGKPVVRPLSFVGMAFQNPALLPWRTTLGNLLLPLEIVEPYRSRFRKEKAAYSDEAMRLLDATGVADFANHYPWMLSGGMRQRVNLCRSLIHRPELLLLDEPFAALDAFTREELWGVLQSMWQDRRFTSLLVTHDLREAVFLADFVVVMSARPGQIVDVIDVDIPRPRTIEAAFSPEFTGTVRKLREAISIVMRDRR